MKSSPRLIFVETISTQGKPQQCLRSTGIVGSAWLRQASPSALNWFNAVAVDVDVLLTTMVSVSILQKPAGTLRAGFCVSGL
jgi:hypothetical protein